MKLKQLYSFFVQQGIKNDPRGSDSVNELLSERKQSYEKLSKDEKEFFDTETLTNPYSDSRILNGTGEENISSVMVGIDMETPELLLAHTLRSSGKKIDLVMAHHPEGRAYATFYDVMAMQSEILNIQGVPISIAEAITNKRLKQVGRSVKPQNHYRPVDAAKLLDIPYMTAHTVADNHVATFLQNLFDKKKPKFLKDVIKILNDIPEYKEARKNSAGPFILVGSKENRAGKIFVDMTGGTEGAKESTENLAKAGVSTIIGMHMSESHYKDAEKHNIRVIIAGHISSDNLGINLLLDSAEKELGKFDVIECSGFRRIKRK
ncbi:NGG1p interacting factor NIF3 [Elusimicrobiota bacterium]